MVALMGEGLQIITFFSLISQLEALLLGHIQVGGGVCITDMHVANTVRPLLSEVPDNKAPLMLRVLLSHN